MTEVKKQGHGDIADLPEGFKMTELGLLPEEWRMVRLGDLARQGMLVIRNGFAQGQHNESGKGVPHLRPFNIDDNGNLTMHQVKYVPPPQLDSPYWLRAGDIVFNNTNSEELVGKTGYFDLDVPCVLSNHMTLIRVMDASVLEPYWLARILHFFYQYGVFRSLCRRHVNQASVSLQRLLSLYLPLPPLPEQRVIAHVLRTVQRAKEATERVIQATRELKKSLMRYLFTYGPVPVEEAEKVPLKETEIGLVPEHWEVVRLGDVTHFESGKREKGGGKTTGEVWSIGGEHITEDGQLDFSTPRFISREFYSKMHKGKVKLGDILVCKDGARTGKSAFVEKMPLTGLAVNEHVFIVRSGNDNRLVPRFLGFWFRSEQAWQQIYSAYHGLIGGITQQQIREFIIPLPPLSEQHEIARIFQAVDQKVQAEEARKQALEALFKTLLHNLMTGKIRVKDVILPETKETI
ncbi:MAG: restriction modification system specificity domain protein [Defluviitaleaceae bacterium]|nr:restriction modification system specificity domain protein [Defluviitaleaceae bacterium]SFE28273.1 type I restriction enzyme, S subunit [Thermoanaerobacter thermohydrosulfuricus]